MVSAGSDVLWTSFQETEVTVSAIVAHEEKVAESNAEQVWKMNIILSAPLPGSNKLQETAYVVLVKTDNTWRFDRFLLKPEIDSVEIKKISPLSKSKGLFSVK
jgi:dephospho-CoA kinase